MENEFKHFKWMRLIRGQNRAAQTPGYQNALTSEEGSPCMCPADATSLQTRGYSMVWCNQPEERGCFQQVWCWFERQVTTKRRKKKKSKSWILAILPSKEVNWWGSPSRSHLLDWDRAPCWGKWQLFMLSSSDKFCPEPGRWEWPPGCLGAGGALHFASV